MKYLLYPFKWFSQIFTEADGNGGKASFSRVFGGFLTLVIIKMAWVGKTIPEPLITMFWVLVGYQLLSKALGPDGVRAILSRGSPAVPVQTPAVAPAVP